MRHKNSESLAAFIGLWILGLWLLLVVSLVLLKIWLIGSLVTSSLKSVNNDCGQKYTIETFFDGNWFCDLTKTQSSIDKPINITGAY